jgi:hypothetical protein
MKVGGVSCIAKHCRTSKPACCCRIWACSGPVSPDCLHVPSYGAPALRGRLDHGVPATVASPILTPFLMCLPRSRSIFDSGSRRTCASMSVAIKHGGGRVSMHAMRPDSFRWNFQANSVESSQSTDREEIPFHAASASDAALASATPVRAGACPTAPVSGSRAGCSVSSGGTSDCDARPVTATPRTNGISAQSLRPVPVGRVHCSRSVSYTSGARSCAPAVPSQSTLFVLRDATRSYATRHDRAGPETRRSVELVHRQLDCACQAFTCTAHATAMGCELMMTRNAEGGPVGQYPARSMSAKNIVA